jgi:hypothetical protein
MQSIYELKATGVDQSRGCVDSFPALVKALTEESARPDTPRFGVHGVMLVTYDEAVNIIKRPRLVRFIHVYHQSPNKKSDGMAWRVIGSVEVPRRTALKFLEDVYKRHADDGMVELSLHGNCLFIG